MELNKKNIKAIKKNDRRVILQLYNFTFNKLMSVAVRYFVNEEDRVTIVNNSFMKIIDNIDKFTIGTYYFSWVNRITYNEIVNFHRKEKKYKSVFNFETYDVAINTYSDDNIEDNSWIDEAELLALVLKLPKSTRIVFDMYAIEGGYKYKDIAECLDVSVETVKWHLKQARKSLKAEIINLKQKEYA